MTPEKNLETLRLAFCDLPPPPRGFTCQHIHLVIYPVASRQGGNLHARAECWNDDGASRAWECSLGFIERDSSAWKSFRHKAQVLRKDIPCPQLDPGVWYSERFGDKGMEYRSTKTR